MVFAQIVVGELWTTISRGTPAMGGKDFHRNLGSVVLSANPLVEILERLLLLLG